MSLLNCWLGSIEILLRAGLETVWIEMAKKSTGVFELWYYPGQKPKALITLPIVPMCTCRIWADTYWWKKYRYEKKGKK